MPQNTSTFRVFISSTFSDLKEERNALQERVFPKLRALAAEHSRQFQAIDLRWGVSQEASQDQQTMNICLGEIDRCQKVTPRPNFLVLMGDRYGWMPPPPQIEAEEFKKILNELSPGEKLLLQWDESKKTVDKPFKMTRWDPAIRDYVGDQGWYRLDNNFLTQAYVLQPWEGLSYDEWGEIETRIHAVLEKGARSAGLNDAALFKYWASATHQEIRAGALDVGEAGLYVHCFTREILGFPEKFDPQAFWSDLDQRLSEENPGTQIAPVFEAYLEELKQTGPSASAAEINTRLKALTKETNKETPERDFLEKISGWLVDFSGKDFFNLKDVDWTIDHAAIDHLKALKHELGELPGNTKEPYKAYWTGRGVTTDHINQLCEDVFSALSGIILKEIEDPIPVAAAGKSKLLIQPHAALDEEGAAHRAFADERLANFVGRTTILKQIEGYLNNSDSRILAVYGKGGTGKSAVAAKALQTAQENHPRAEIVYRFIGATPSSSDGRALLDSLCREISRRYGASEADIPLDFQDLATEFTRRMSLASRERPLVLILDSLDQLSKAHDARKLTWLPNQLPEHVHFLVTTRQFASPEHKEEAYVNLGGKQVLLAELRGLSRDDGKKLLKAWLKEHGRTLQELQEEAVLDRFEDSDGTPLYLKLAAEEARLWPSGNGLPPEKLAAGIEGIIEQNLINRLADESNHGQMIISKVLGYLAASRYGLAEDEIMDILSRDHEMYLWFFSKSFHLPADLIQWAAWYQRGQTEIPSIESRQIDKDEERAAQKFLKEIRNPPERVSEFLKEVLPKPQGPRLPVVLWSRLFLDLEPYLSRRTSEGSTLLTFYHRELNDVSRKVYLAKPSEQHFHKNLASYFQFKADPGGTGEWDGSYPRGLSELPYHQTEAKMGDEVFQTLTDFKFLEQKAAKVGVLESKDDKGNPTPAYTGTFQLQEDYARALSAVTGDAGPAPGSGKPPLILTAVEKNAGLSIYCPACNKTSPIDVAQLGSVIACPQPACSRPLKINRFVTKVA